MLDNAIPAICAIWIALIPSILAGLASIRSDGTLPIDDSSPSASHGTDPQLPSTTYTRTAPLTTASESVVLCAQAKLSAETNTTVPATATLVKRTLPLPTNNTLTQFILDEVRLAREEGYVVEPRPGDTGGASSAIVVPLTNERFNAAVEGLQGCTSVIIVSQRGVYLSRFWEVPSFASQSDFDRDVLGTIWDGDGTEWMPGLREHIAPGELFHYDTNPYVIIYTPGYDNVGEQGDTTNKQGDQLDQQSDEIDGQGQEDTTNEQGKGDETAEQPDEINEQGNKKIKRENKINKPVSRKKNRRDEQSELNLAYPGAIAQLKATLLSQFPSEKIQIYPYIRVPYGGNRTSLANSARGKVLVQYDPDEDDTLESEDPRPVQKAMLRVWLGDRDDYVYEDEWTAHDDQLIVTDCAVSRNRKRDVNRMGFGKGLGKGFGMKPPKPKGKPARKGKPTGSEKDTVQTN